MRSPLPLAGPLAQPDLWVRAALVLLAALAWLQLASSTTATQHLVHGMTHAAPRAWLAADAGMALLMWLVMAVAMMLPTAAPAILSFADIVRGSGRGSAGHDRLAAFVGGYLAAWWAFGVLATLAQWTLAATAVRVPGLRADRPLLAGLLLIVAGLYQFSALKNLCLTLCRSPLTFFLTHWRDGTRGALHLGLRHGVHCVGCCWALMALMLAAGAMNIAWTAALTALMLAEKVLPGGKVVGRAVGIGLCLWGGALLASA